MSTGRPLDREIDAADAESRQERAGGWPRPCTRPGMLFDSNASPACPRARETRVRTLLERHFDFVWRSLRRLGVREADADDATQEVFVVAARRLDDVLEDRERAFLFGTAVRVCSTRRRLARRHPEDPSGAGDEHAVAGPNPEELAVLREAKAELARLLDGLGADLSSVFVLAELEELSVREIAALLGIPEGTVSSRLRAARSRMQKALERRQVRERFATGNRPGPVATAPFRARFSVSGSFC
jgi:RNA polymerase sigma-70 factor (ECF subfamily)